jgi:hypothetical protein
VEILTQTQSFTKSHLNALTIKNETASTAISKIDTTHDQNMFITFNLRHFTAPADWKFEACPSYYDTVSDVEHNGSSLSESSLIGDIKYRANPQDLPPE